MKNKYFLTGIPQCGKLTLGQKVAEQLGLPCYNIYKMVMEIMNLRGFHGDPRPEYNLLRKLSRVALKQLCAREGPAIILVHADVRTIPGCVDIMKREGIQIFIDRDADLIHDTLDNMKDSKLMVRINGELSLDYLRVGVDSYDEDHELYAREADYVISNNGSVDEGVRQLHRLISRLSAESGV